MNTKEHRSDKAKKIEHYSLTQIIYGFGMGATGLIAIEKFIEGRYYIGIVSAAASALCGLMAYFANRTLNNDTRELSERVRFYRNELNNAQKEVIFYCNRLDETQVGLYNAYQKKMLPAKNLEEISKQSAKILPFNRSLKLVTEDEDSTDPAA